MSSRRLTLSDLLNDAPPPSASPATSTSTPPHAVAGLLNSPADREPVPLSLQAFGRSRRSPSPSPATRIAYIDRHHHAQSPARYDPINEPPVQALSLAHSPSSAFPYPQLSTRRPSQSPGSQSTTSLHSQRLAISPPLYPHQLPRSSHSPESSGLARFAPSPSHLQQHTRPRSSSHHSLSYSSRTPQTSSSALPGPSHSSLMPRPAVASSPSLQSPLGGLEALVEAATAEHRRISENARRRSNSTRSGTSSDINMFRPSTSSTTLSNFPPPFATQSSPSPLGSRGPTFLRPQLPVSSGRTENDTHVHPQKRKRPSDPRPYELEEHRDLIGPGMSSTRDVAHPTTQGGRPLVSPLAERTTESWSEKERQVIALMTTGRRSPVREHQKLSLRPPTDATDSQPVSPASLRSRETTGPIRPWEDIPTQRDHSNLPPRSSNSNIMGWRETVHHTALQDTTTSKATVPSDLLSMTRRSPPHLGGLTHPDTIRAETVTTSSKGTAQNQLPVERAQSPRKDTPAVINSPSSSILRRPNTQSVLESNALKDDHSSPKRDGVVVQTIHSSPTNSPQVPTTIFASASSMNSPEIIFPAPVSPNLTAYTRVPTPPPQTPTPSIREPTPTATPEVFETPAPPQADVGCDESEKQIPIVDVVIARVPDSLDENDQRLFDPNDSKLRIASPPMVVLSTVSMSSAHEQSPALKSVEPAPSPLTTSSIEQQSVRQLPETQTIQHDSSCVKDAIKTPVAQDVPVTVPSSVDKELEEATDIASVKPMTTFDGEIMRELNLDNSQHMEMKKRERGPVGKRQRLSPDDMDIDSELLSLVEEKPEKLHSQILETPKPKSGTQPAEQQKQQPQGAPASPQLAGPGIPPTGMQAAPPSQEAVKIERGSMPPPLGEVPRARSQTPKDEETAGLQSKKRPPRPSLPKKPSNAGQGVKKSRSKPSAPSSKSKAKTTSDSQTPSISLPKGRKSMSAVTSSKSPAARSRSTSAMPPSSLAQEIKFNDFLANDGSEKLEEEEEEEEEEEDKLYCVCKTPYDEEKVMIACDRCDEWYHTTCVNMSDFEIDLVDQFICPPCGAREPHLTLHTTYKRRCSYGLQHDDPDSADACHKPARGALSKYCSDECGIKCMQMRIYRWTTKGGDKDRLWESVKNAERREGVVQRVANANAHTNGESAVNATVGYMLLKPTKTKAERALGRLNAQLDDIVWKREHVMKQLEIVSWREKVTTLAVRRAETSDNCGWDQRLCFGDEEITEFGSGVVESYHGTGQGPGADDVHSDAMPVDSADEAEWWCRGKKKCERHAGWQKLRVTEVEVDKEMKELALERLTTRERKIRKRMEDLVDPDTNSHLSTSGCSISPSKALDANHEAVTNGVLSPNESYANGDTKKGKKKGQSSGHNPP